MASRESRAPCRKNRSAIEPAIIDLQNRRGGSRCRQKRREMAVATRASVKRSGAGWRERPSIMRSADLSVLMPEETRILLAAEAHRSGSPLQFQIAHADFLTFARRALPTGNRPQGRTGRAHGREGPAGRNSAVTPEIVW